MACGGFTWCGYCSLCMMSTMFLFLVLIALNPVHSDDDAGDYLYNVLEEDEYYPVIEYVAPPRPNVTKEVLSSKNESALPLDRPDFLYKAEGTNARIVEFYAPWCPHCRHFKQKYIDFSRQMKKVLKRYDIEMDFYAVSCVPNKRLCSSQNVKGYPTVKVFRANSINGSKVPYYELHPFDVLKHIGVKQNTLESMEDEDSKTLNDIAMSKEKLRKKDKKVAKFSSRTKKELYDDAYKSFVFSMRNSIFVEGGPLSKAKKEALDEWLYLLKCVLPPTWHAHDLINALVKNFDNITQSEDYLDSILDQYPLKKPENQWSLHCTKGEQGMGYTCGLWTLFHIMSIGIVEWNSLVTSDDGWDYYKTADVAETLRKFVEHFFGCDVCRINFLQSYDTCGSDRCNRLSDSLGEKEDWIQFALWLYQEHNSVNVRLLKEKHERDGINTPTLQQKIKAQWPPKQLCPRCWLDQEEEQWDEQVVYNYLRLEYWEEDPTAVAIRKEMVALSKIDDYHTYFADDEYDDISLWNIRTVMKAIPIIIVTVVLVGTYMEKRKRRLTGLHKKVDAE